MIFTSTPQNGSSWQDSLSFGLDTEQEQPIDITLRISNSTDVIAQRRLYGVTRTEVDIAPYLRAFGYKPPTINNTITVGPSQSAQCIKLTANDVDSSSINLFHTPYDPTTAHTISYGPTTRTIAANEPILITAYAQQLLMVNVTFYTAISSRSLKCNVNTAGLPQDIVIPTTVYPANVERISVEILGDKSSTTTYMFHILPKRENGWCIAWFNKHGGIETYTFPTSMRLSYDAKIDKNDDSSLGQFPSLHNPTVNYRLCSAYESQEQMERLAEMVFSPRIFAISGAKYIPITMKQRHIEFDAHGKLRQMCFEVERPWEGGEL